MMPSAASVRDETCRRRKKLLVQFSPVPPAALLGDLLHVMDPDVARRAFTDAGFVVEDARAYTRLGLPGPLRLDGRENTALITRKP